MRMPRMFVLAAMLCAGAVLAPLGEAHAALHAFLKLKGQRVGEIRGGVTQKGREGFIKVISVAHEISSTQGAGAGSAGKRVHKPFVVMVEVDRATPQLLNAVAGGEKFAAFSLEVAGPSGGASLYRVNLVNAAISSFDLVTLEGGGAAALRLAFTYSKIEWTWLDGGVTGSDDWETPVVKKSL